MSETPKSVKWRKFLFTVGFVMQLIAGYIHAEQRQNNNYGNSWSYYSYYSQEVLQLHFAGIIVIFLALIPTLIDWAPKLFKFNTRTEEAKERLTISIETLVIGIFVMVIEGNYYYVDMVYNIGIFLLLMGIGFTITNIVLLSIGTHHAKRASRYSSPSSINEKKYNLPSSTIKRYCPICGKEMSDLMVETIQTQGVVFCEHCGAKCGH